MKNYKLKIIIFSLFLLSFFAGCVLNKTILSLQMPNGAVKSFLVEVASTPEAMARGLMFRKNLPENEGMFFVFDKPQKFAFWMKNTLIPLDMVFIDSGWRVVDIKKMSRPCEADPCPTYVSAAPAQYVLEIGGGLSDRLGIIKGVKALLTIRNYE